MSTNRIRILLVDDDPAVLRSLSPWLEKAGYETRCASDGEQAMAACRDDCPQILITDWQMPHVDGVQLCRWLREEKLPHYVYTMLMTGPDTQDMVQALDAGADDFLPKPVDKSELLARVRSGVRVLELQSRLQTLASSDPLTGLATRRTFFELIESEWSRAQRYRIPVSCVMIDIDFFKRINDMLGHQAGDDAIRGIAQVLQDNCRGSDIIGRYGGEEFCVLLPETNEDDAIVWSNRVRSALAARHDLIRDRNITITASFGVAQMLDDTNSPEELVDLADQALLVAKRSGRDRVVGFQTITADNEQQPRDTGPGAVFDGRVAKDVMTTIIAGLKEEETVGRAARYFLRFRFNSAPVVDEEGRLVGILSERDVMSIMLGPKWWQTKIKDVMKRNVVRYEEDTPVLMIYEFLSRVLIRGVVIVKDGRPTGMISRSSLLRWFTNLLAVTPGRAHEGPLLDFDDDPEVPSLSPEPRDNMAMIARALAEQAADLEQRISGEADDFVPVIVGGVSRIEELLNDLLAFSRYAKAPPQQAGFAKASDGGGDGDTVTGLAALANRMK